MLGSNATAKRLDSVNLSNLLFSLARDSLHQGSENTNEDSSRIVAPSSAPAPVSSLHQEQLTDICNKCHPFFTGTQKLIDTGGRVQRFADKFGSAADMVAKAEAEKKAAKAAKAEPRYR